MTWYRLLFFCAVAGVSLLAFIPTYEPLPPVVSFSDILNHFMAFSTLALLFDLAFPRYTCRFKFLALLTYGIFIEAVQFFLPNRDASLKDIAIDATAVLSVYALLLLTRKHLPSMRRHSR